MLKEIVLKDDLKHKKFNWPDTLLTYDVLLDSKDDIGYLTFCDDSGNNVDFQISDVEDKNGKIKCNLNFVSSLACGEEKKFYLGKGDVASCGDAYFNGECIIDFPVDVPANGKEVTLDNPKDISLFDIKSLGEHFIAHLDCDKVTYKCLEYGKVFVRYLVSIILSGDRTYNITLKSVAGIPFVEMTEEMTGFADDESAELIIDTNKFNAKTRYAFARPVEKVDAYLREDSEIPVVVMPYENWNPWFQSKYIVFNGDKTSVGLFIKDSAKWDDLKFPIWGSRIDFAVKFKYDTSLKMCFPLRSGKRCNAIAIYDADCTSDEHKSYIEYLWHWYTFLNLDKTRKWHLKWDEDKSSYPKFFKAGPGDIDKFNVRLLKSFGEDKVDNTCLLKLIDKYSKSMNNIFALNPVDSREFFEWCFLFDITASSLTDEQYDHARAAFAFMAYAEMDDNFMPTKTMLSGHPNFLFDVAAVPGLACALFGKNPDKDIWYDYYRRVTELNTTYHIRPDVPDWEAEGGRWTENVSCYNFASFKPFTNVCKLLEMAGFDNPMHDEKVVKWLKWILNIYSAPVGGERILPPQGAHADRDECGYIGIVFNVYMAAQMMKSYAPELADEIFKLCKGSKLKGVEEFAAADPWKSLLDFSDVKDEAPNLTSKKYTGYGYILRHNVGQPNEISVHIQQIDEGPNYRYGTFENTGNGGIFYYANNKRYSFSRPEDLGDENLGAEEGSCNFAVLNGHTYKNIGRAELTNPLYNFDFAQSVKLSAGESAKPFYRYRTVMMSEGDYIVLYDAVDDFTTRGRFSWFANATESLPNIYQLKPGTEMNEYNIYGAVNRVKNPKIEWGGKRESMGVGFDGNGDFLTIVSHIDKSDMKVIRTEYGAYVKLKDREDYVFADSALIDTEDCGKDYGGYCPIVEKLPSFGYAAKKIESAADTTGIRFIGYNGIVQKKDDGYNAAIFDGHMIEIDGFKVEFKVYHEQNAISIVHTGDKWYGHIAVYDDTALELNVPDGYTLYVQGEERKGTLTLPKGHYGWCISKDASDAKEHIEAVREFKDTNPKFVRDTRSHEFGFDGFDFRGNFEKGILEYPGQK